MAGVLHTSDLSTRCLFAEGGSSSGVSDGVPSGGDPESDSAPNSGLEPRSDMPGTRLLELFRKNLRKKRANLPNAAAENDSSAETCGRMEGSRVAPEPEESEASTRANLQGLTYTTADGEMSTAVHLSGGISGHPQIAGGRKPQPEEGSSPSFTVGRPFASATPCHSHMPSAGGGGDSPSGWTPESAANGGLSTSIPPHPKEQSFPSATGRKTFASAGECHSHTGWSLPSSGDGGSPSGWTPESAANGGFSPKCGSMQHLQAVKPQKTCAHSVESPAPALCNPDPHLDLPNEAEILKEITIGLDEEDGGEEDEAHGGEDDDYLCTDYLCTAYEVAEPADEMGAFMQTVPDDYLTIPLQADRGRLHTQENGHSQQSRECLQRLQVQVCFEVQGQLH